MLTRILLAAILAGVLSGVFVTAVQAYRVTPLILQAETYENGGGSHEHGTKHTTSSEKGAPEDNETSAEAWAPADGVERTLYTMLANILVGVSFSLILTAGVLLTNSGLSVRSGLVWGACGFAVFVLAPNFGLSPELPGMPAADLTQRQIWWTGTVIATAAALYIFAFRKHLIWMLIGLALIVAPHIYGAPVPVDHHTNVPAHLAAEFVTATIITSLVFWLFLGGLLGLLMQRVVGKNSDEQSI